MRFRQAAIACGLILALAAAGPADQLKKLGGDAERALASIRAMDAYEYTRTMASPEFAGRLTGHDGYTAAARWAAAKFKDWGLRPLGPKEGYLQAYPSPYTVVDKAEMSVFLAEGTPAAGEEPSFREVKLVPEKDFLPLLYSDSGDRTAGLVFAGWGISAPELGYDDYAGLEVRGKFVLCFRGTPERDKKWQRHDEHRTRMKTAAGKGALGIVYIYSEVASNPNGDWIAGFTPALVSDKIADLILKEKESSAADLRKALQTFKRPISFPLRSKVRLAVESRHVPGGIGYNVAGWVEGSDPKLKSEILVLGAHFDHDGLHMGLLFPGADDNASGSAAVMEIAEAFSKLGRKPKRSVAFVLFGGEELGLQGSYYFADHVPPVLTKLDAMFNFDMVGEGDGAGSAVSADSAQLKATLEEADRYIKILRGTGLIREVGVRSSDFAPFFLKGLPCASFHSNGPHLAYHMTGDTIYRINPDIMADIAKLAFLTALFWADR